MNTTIMVAPELSSKQLHKLRTIEMLGESGFTPDEINILMSVSDFVGVQPISGGKVWGLQYKNMDSGLMLTVESTTVVQTQEITLSVSLLHDLMIGAMLVTARSPTPTDISSQLYDVQRACTDIGRTTRRGCGNFIIANDNYLFTAKQVDLFSRQNQTLKSCSAIPEYQLIVGYKGSPESDAGLFLAVEKVNGSVRYAIVENKNAHEYYRIVKQL